MSVPVLDVVVAGAGIIGCAIAYELAKCGYRVEVFEARQVGRGATHATAGVLAPFIETPASPTLQALTLESFRMYDRFVADVQSASLIDVEYRRCGTFEIAFSNQDAERLNHLAELARAAGLTAEWRERDPTAPHSGTGLFIPAQGYVRVEQLMVALQRGAEQRGVLFHREEPIDGIDPTDGAVIVRTPSRWVTCAAVVLAAGSWSDMIGFEQVGVRPVRGQLLRVGWQGQLPPYVMWTHDCYIVPWLDGTLLVGATLEDVGFDERVTTEGVRQLLAALCRILPGAENATFLEARAGLRPSSGDGMPVIRPSTRTPRVIYATGHYRNGVLLAPLTARRVADLVAAVSPKP